MKGSKALFIYLLLFEVLWSLRMNYEVNHACECKVYKTEGGLITSSL